MENKTIPGVGKIISFVFSEKEKRSLPKRKKHTKKQHCD